MKALFTSLFILFSFIVFGQSRIDGTFAFQTDPAKKYSIYVPSTYDASAPNRLMIGLHPWNTNRWDAQSWCDTLIAFAETNNLILACPDGGADGQVDDAIDTAFTSALIDSMYSWYNVDADKVYAMGFSWGGLTTYTYGLNHISDFKGFIPIGAAINGPSEIGTSISNASGIPFYVIHGGNDAPGISFTPVLNALNSAGAITNSLLMPGVGHTIDFANRNQILTTAFLWVDSVNCSSVNTGLYSPKFDKLELNVYPTNLSSGQELTIDLSTDNADSIQFLIVDQQGKVVLQESRQSTGGVQKLQLTPPQLPKGIYFIQVIAGQSKSTKRLVIGQ